MPTDDNDQDGSDVDHEGPNVDDNARIQYQHYAGNEHVHRITFNDGAAIYSVIVNLKHSHAAGSNDHAHIDDTWLDAVIHGATGIIDHLNRTHRTGTYAPGDGDPSGGVGDGRRPVIDGRLRNNPKLS